MMRFCGKMDNIDKIKPFAPNSSIKKATVNPNINPLNKITAKINGIPMTESPNNINKTAVFKLFDIDKKKMDE